MNLDWLADPRHLDWTFFLHPVNTGFLSKPLRVTKTKTSNFQDKLLLRLPADQLCALLRGVALSHLALLSVSACWLTSARPRGSHLRG